MRYKIKSNCKVCGNEIVKRSAPLKRKTGISKIMKSNAVTCSHECSIKYNRNKWKYKHKGESER